MTEYLNNIVLLATSNQIRANNTTITTQNGSTVTLSLPNVTTNDNLVSDTSVDTLTNKTLTAPTISGGTIDNAVVGGTTPAAGTFTTLSSSNASITGGSINGTTIGASTPAAGTFTTLGTSNATITGGSINGTSIGATTASTGKFTTITGQSEALTNTTNQLTLGTTNTTTVSAPAPAASITLTLPSTASDTLVGQSTAATLTNKTLDSATNTVAANRIFVTGGGAADVVLSSTAPTAGQALIATSATAAAWQAVTAMALPATVLGSGTLTTSTTTPNQVLQTLTTDTNATVIVTVRVAVYDNTATTNSAGFQVQAAFQNRAGTVTQLGTGQISQSYAPLLFAIPTLAISGTNIQVQVTPPSTDSLTWVSSSQATYSS